MSRRLPVANGNSAIARRKAARKRLPSWFRTSLPTGTAQEAFIKMRENVSKNSLNTVCEEARCPNIHDCWGRGTATFMIAGQSCTRGCKFCAVGTLKNPLPLDPEEPDNLAEAVDVMGISHAVITVVNRDDLSDGGASHYRDCILSVNERSPDVGLELLCSDLDGNMEALSILLSDLPLRVFAHNVECVPRLDKLVRDSRASFQQSLDILSEAARLRPDLKIKSSLMVGLGETKEEVIETLHDLKNAKVDIVTIGQYLQPSKKHLSVKRFVNPEEFEDYKKIGLNLGFKHVESSALVRSSYKAQKHIN